MFFCSENDFSGQEHAFPYQICRRVVYQMKAWFNSFLKIKLGQVTLENSAIPRTMSKNKFPKVFSRRICLPQVVDHSRSSKFILLQRIESVACIYFEIREQF